ncbi:MAG: MFS transporter [Zoogloeaceae bacterium]|nr:MFS transporter [Zoogloeaceae bacterium]
MTPLERRAGISLAAIFALRMLGLFLVLPVFAVFAKTIPGGEDLTLVGIAIGAYGLTQAFLQIPCGMASDRIGRKPVIVFGLVLFALGSVVAALSHDIYGIIAGRVLQGAGAISAAVTALAADLTRDQHRTKVMAMIGSSIGLVFAASLVLAPVLYAAVGMAGIFWLTGGLALAALATILFVVPAAPPVPKGTGGRFFAVITNRQLMRLNFGVFALHAMQTAMWVRIPSALVATGGMPVADHWKVYLPAVLASFLLMVPAIIIAERRGRLKPIFLMAIGLLLIVQTGLYFDGAGLWALAFWIALFFVGFNILEATQPSWISRIAPPQAKGAALGIYNTLQSLGLFFGGAVGGLIAENWGFGALSAFSGMLAILWLIASIGLVPPVRRLQTDPPSAVMSSPSAGAA